MASRLRIVVGLSVVGTMLGAGCAEIVGFGDKATLAPIDGGVIDSGDETPSGTDDSGRPFCDSFATQPAFCHTFDGVDYLAGWEPGSTKNGRVERSTTLPLLSMPAALRVALPGTGTPSVGVGVAFPSWIDRAKSVTVDLAVRVSEASGTAVIALPYLNAVPSAGPAFLLQLTARAGPNRTISFGLTEVAEIARTHLLSGEVPLDTWARLHIVVTLATSAASPTNEVEVSLDGTVRFSGPLELGPGSGYPGTQLGFSYVSDVTRPWTVEYDDVAVDIR